MATPAPVTVVECQAQGLLHCHMDVELCGQQHEFISAYLTKYVMKGDHAYR